MLRLAVFADLHGKLLLPFKLADHWQRATGQRLDLLLQCGDVGAFPDRKKLDRATLKHARNDRDELGFHDDFVRPKPEIRRFLDGLGLEMWCVRGNHEDHGFLDGLETAAGAAPRYAIDGYGRVLMLRSGVAQHFDKDGLRLNLLGIGRIGDRKGRTEPRFIQPAERETLRRTLNAGHDFQLLLSHDMAPAPENPGGEGLADIDTALDQCPFVYHFHGHTGQPYAAYPAANGITTSVKVRELEFNAAGQLEPGCMVIVQWDGERWQLEPVPLALIKGFSRHCWRQL